MRRYNGYWRNRLGGKGRAGVPRVPPPRWTGERWGSWFDMPELRTDVLEERTSSRVRRRPVPGAPPRSRARARLCDRERTCWRSRRRRRTWERVAQDGARLQRMTSPLDETWTAKRENDLDDNPLWMVVNERKELVADTIEESTAKLVAQAPAMARLLLEGQWLCEERGDLCRHCDRLERDGHAADCELAIVLRGAGLLP